MFYKNLFNLENKNIFITGGAGLIGSEITKAVAELGGTPIIVDINEKLSVELCKKLINDGFKCNYENIDLTKLENIESVIDELIKKYLIIDSWINNAYPRTSDWGNKVEDLTLESWRQNVDMHMNSYSWISRKVCMQMKEQGFGSLINFGSTYGLLGNDLSIYEGTSMTSPMGYSAIKGGIINLSRYLSAYFGPFGVRVNNLCPGGIFNNQPESFVKKYSEKTPLRRMGKPQEIAAACMFLASDASSYVNGHSFVVDGGWSII